MRAREPRCQVVLASGGQIVLCDSPQAVVTRWRASRASNELIEAEAYTGSSLSTGRVWIDPDMIQAVVSAEIVGEANGQPSAAAIVQG
jgi:hypothetical protein